MTNGDASDPQAGAEPRPKTRLHLREIVSHGSVFGIGLVISRMTSILLLPVYTRVLSPADYGVLAILDLFQELLRVMIATGLMSAAARFHFEHDDFRYQSRVWWTTLISLAGLAIVVIGIVVPFSGFFARVTIGGEVSDGATLYALMLGSLLVGIPEGLFQNHLRLMKRSQMYVVISLVRLFFNASLNILLLYKFELGVAGVLTGNLVTGVLWAALHFVIFRYQRGPMLFDFSLLRPMLHFGAPLMGVTFMSMGMHQLDRYLLLLFVSRHFISMSDLGIYQFAYQIGQGVNSLLLLPFSQIWAVVVFEIARSDDANRTFALIFRYFVRGLMLLLLGAALASSLAVRLLATPEYAPAADLIPVIAFSYFFFSLDEHFRVPALIRKKTVAMLPVYLVAVLLNLGLNLVLIPLWGVTGAAWASVGTFIGFAFVGLKRYRRIDRIEYPLWETGMVVATCVGAYLVFRLAVPDRDSWSAMGIAAVLWLILAVPMMREPVRLWLRRH